MPGRHSSPLVPTPPVPDGGVPPSVRAQLLATEHWSLLATRGMAQSEVLSRISMYLTLVSAGIVALALTGQVTEFDQRFQLFAVVLLAVLLAVGALTTVRVLRWMEEDQWTVIGMNRLRAAYTAIDPGIERYLVTSRHDDEPGIVQTYSYRPAHRDVAQPLASSGLFIIVVNGIVAALLGGFAAALLEGGRVAIGATAAVCGVGFVAVWAGLGARRYFRRQAEYVALFPGIPTPRADSQPAPRDGRGSAQQRHVSWGS